MENISRQDERRRDLRVATSKPLMIKLYIKKVGGFFNFRRFKRSRVKDISVGGVCLELPVLKDSQIKRVQEGLDNLVLELKLPKANKTIKLNSKISRIEKGAGAQEDQYIAGLSFDEMRQEDREKLLYELMNMCLESRGALRK